MCSERCRIPEIYKFELYNIQGVRKVAVQWAAVYRGPPRTLNELKTAIIAEHKKHLTSISAESV
jgi:hypothetical protein